MADSLLQKLKVKHGRNEIYTYISEVLVALNPNASRDEFYSFEMIEKYRQDSFNVLPSHIFKLAAEVIKHLRMFKVSQSVVISGLTGSGKTEATKHLLKFFCGLKSNQFAEHILNANFLLETFGNSATIRNANSSRFTKVLEMNYDPNVNLCGIKFDFHLLETNRVCIGSHANFHIFYYLLYGSTEDLRETLHLNKFLFSCLPEQPKLQTTTCSKSFQKVDQALNSLKLTEHNKVTIFKLLASIMHLGNVEFKDVVDYQAEIMELSAKHIDYAAKLLNITVDELKEALLYKKIKDGKSDIMIPLSAFAARKSRDSMCKAIYSRLFGSVVASINQVDFCDFHSDISTIMLDIAGFECFDTNRYEQFCINYTNEKLHQFCTQRLIHSEQEWYRTEDLKLPQIAFPGNEAIVDLFENKTSGIFSQLDDECKMKSPKLQNFIIKVANHARSPSIFRIQTENDNSEFIIRHFTHDVSYTTENFIENNSEIYTTSICNLLEKSLSALSSFPGSTRAVLDISKIKKSTTSATLRMNINQLISRLKQTNPNFIRCVKPNSQQIPELFDDNLVLDQLKSSGTIAYYEMMQFGFPGKLKITDLFDKLKPALEPRHDSIRNHTCCTILLLASGFKSTDFKIGKSWIHIRPGNLQLLEQIQYEIGESSNELALRFKNGYIVHMHRVFLLGLRFIAKLRLRVKNRTKNRKCPKPIVPTSTKSQMVMLDKETPQNSNKKYDAEENDTAAKSLAALLDENMQTDAKNTSQQTKQTEREQKPKNALRFDGFKHYLDYDDPNEERKGYRCKHCGRQTNTFCTKCKVHLCFVRERAKNDQSRQVRNCARDYHEINES